MKEYQPGIFEYNALAWSCFISSICVAIFALLNGEIAAAILFLFFASLGVLMSLIASSIKINEEAVFVNTLFSEYKMFWSQIEFLEVGTSMFVFHGKGKKRLVMPFQWSGEQSEDAHIFFNQQLVKFNIKHGTGIFADYKIHKNVRV